MMYHAAARCLLGAITLLTSCTVYAPMQPTVSTIRQAGQAELTASIQPNLRLETGAVVSPLPHVLLAAAGTYRPRLPSNDTADRTYFTTRQWEASAGTYWPLGEHWLLTGLGGYGYARTERKWTEIGIILNGPSSDWQARHGKWFGQVGLGRERDEYGLGIVYRYTRLTFDALRYTNSYAAGEMDGSTQVRHELLLYHHRPWLNSPRGRWQVRSAAGVSFSSTPQLPDQVPGSFEFNDNLQPMLLCSIGLVFGWEQRTTGSAPTGDH